MGTRYETRSGNMGPISASCGPAGRLESALLVRILSGDLLNLITREKVRQIIM